MNENDAESTPEGKMGRLQGRRRPRRRWALGQGDPCPGPAPLRQVSWSCCSRSACSPPSSRSRWFQSGSQHECLRVAPEDGHSGPETFKRRSPTTSPPRSSRSSTRRPKYASVLPPKAKVIVGPVVLAFQNLVHSAVQKLLASTGFRKSSLARSVMPMRRPWRCSKGKTKGNLVIDGNEVVLERTPSPLRRLQHLNASSSRTCFPIAPRARAPSRHPRTAHRRSNWSN